MTPKIFIYSADGKGRIDPVTMERLLVHIPNRVHSVAEADITLVCISHYGDYSFGSHLSQLRGKKWGMVDFMEYYGQVESGETHLFGKNHDIAYNLHSNPEWSKLNAFCADNPPAIYFKREIFKGMRCPSVQPIEWPCHLPAWEIESKEAFDVRPFEVFFNYGISHCSRPELHGDILKNCCREGYEVINAFEHIDAKINQPGKKWIAIHSPHTHRTHINGIALRQAQSKISVGLRGAGYKCFRSGELVHTVPAIHSPNIEWAFDWQDRYNCIHLPEGHEYETLLEATRTDNLHEIYVNAQRNLDSYRIPNYIDRHVMPSIEAVL